MLRLLKQPQPYNVPLPPCPATEETLMAFPTEQVVPLLVRRMAGCTARCGCRCAAALLQPS